MPEEIKIEPYPISQGWDGVARLMVSSVVKHPIDGHIPGQYTMGPVIHIEPYVERRTFLDPDTLEYPKAIGLDS